MRKYLLTLIALCGCTEQPPQPEQVDAATQRLREQVYDDSAGSVIASEAPAQTAAPITYDAKDFQD